MVTVTAFMPLRNGLDIVGEAHDLVAQKIDRVLLVLVEIETRTRWLDIRLEPDGAKPVKLARQLGGDEVQIGLQLNTDLRQHRVAASTVVGDADHRAPGVWRSQRVVEARYVSNHQPAAANAALRFDSARCTIRLAGGTDAREGRVCSAPERSVIGGCVAVEQSASRLLS